MSIAAISTTPWIASCARCCIPCVVVPGVSNSITPLCDTGTGLAGSALADPVGDLLAHVAHLAADTGDVLAQLAEHRAEALGVELHRLGGLFADVGLLAAAAVLAADDAVVLAALH